MKKLIIVLLAFLTAAAAVAQQVEIYPEMGPQGRPWVKFSPDGKWILTDKGIWDATNGRDLKRPYNTSIIGFSPDMKRYLQGSGTTVRVRDWETDALICTIQNIIANDNDRLPLFSPDGNQVAAVTRDGKKIKICNAGNGQEVMTVDGWENDISRFCYSADGKKILMANRETVKVFDLTNKRQISTFSVKVTEDYFCRAIFSPNGKMYIVASRTGYNGNYHGFVKIYDTDTGRELRTLGHNGNTTALAISFDGQKIIFSMKPDVLHTIMKICDVGTGRELKSIELGSDSENNVEFSADNRRIVYTHEIYNGTGYNDRQKIVVLDAGNYRELFTINDVQKINNVSYTINEKQAIVQTDNIISLWDTETGRRVWSIPIRGESNGYIDYRHIYLSPDKMFFAKADPTTNENQGYNNISIYDIATGKLIRHGQTDSRIIPKE